MSQREKACVLLTLALSLFFCGATQAGEVDLIWSSYLGGSGADGGGGDIAVDSLGYIYVIGETQSSDFPTTVGAFDETHNGFQDVFVVKLNPIGRALEYATFLGGDTTDVGYGIAEDGVGSAYLTGTTFSENFPTTAGAFDTTYNRQSEVFVVKLDAWGGALDYATFLGGSGYDWSDGIALDGSANVYLTGYTWSSDFPTTAGAFDTTYNTSQDAFVAKLDPTGSALDYSTFLGGSDYEWGYSIAVDCAGNVYVTGITWSSDFPTTAGTFDTTFNGPVYIYDVFVAKFDPMGSALDYATFLGGSDFEWSEAIAIDNFGNAYLTGHTRSPNFPTTPGAFDETYNGDEDAFVVKLNPTGSALGYSTFLGGSGFDAGSGLAVDGAEFAHVTGTAGSSDFPITAGAFDTTYNGSQDVFVARVNPTGDVLDYATFLGGSDNDRGCSIALDGSGNVYVTGYTESADFPTTAEAFDTTYNGGGRDVFVAKLNLISTPVESQTATATAAVPKTYTLNQNYPNPFNPATEIAYAIPGDEHVTLKVYNILGAEVATLVDERQEVNCHTVCWDARDLASGVYFCRLQAGEFSGIIKMVLLK